MAETIDSAVSELQKVVAELEADLNNKEEKESSRTEPKIGEAEQGIQGILDLTLGNKRELLTKERAEELFEGIEDDIHEIRLGTKSFGVDAAKVAEKYLKKCSKISVADLADIIAGRPEAEALEVLKLVCGALPVAIKELDLSENALGEKGVRALEPTLRSFETLEGISFYNNGLSELSLKLLSEYVPTEKLQSIHFHNNMSGSGGALALAEMLPKSPALKDLRMSSSRVRPDGGCALIESIGKYAHSLVKLNLGDSMFGEKGGNALAQTLPKLPNLEELVLRDTGLEEDGLESLLSCLESGDVLPNLQLLDISQLEVGCEDNAARVGVVCSKRKKLKHLKLEENELETPGIEKFLDGLGEPSGCSLETLDLRTNEIDLDGARTVVEYFLKVPSCKKIELGDNDIEEDDEESITKLANEKREIEVILNSDYE
mmetsp:Transcript_8263/g.9451  ORF Transcript_8263/g.9451 Transcript_8263/m.9451 type:complete len:432 (-) Transcript_8263:25-1320(-)